MSNHFITPETQPTNSNIRQAKVGQRQRQGWKRWIMQKLGAPVVKVELTEGMVDDAIDTAIKNLAQWGNEFEEFAVFCVTPKQAEYDLREFIPEYIDIKDVVYSPNQAESLLQGFFTDFAFDNRNFFWYHSTYASMTDFYILNAYNEMYLRTIGNEGQWQVIGHTLRLSPTPDKAVFAGIHYIAYPHDNDIRRDEWIREWALTECQISLGNIRSKYQSVPGPRGEVTMNGEQLLQRAAEKQTELLERRDEYIFPAFFETG